MPEPEPAGAPRTPSAAAGARWRTPPRDLLAVGLVGVLLHGVIAWQAIGGLAQVSETHERVTRIASAQRWFQDADMAHDAMRAELLLLVLGDGGEHAALTEEVVDFRRSLARVRTADLPAGLAAAVQDLRPAQDQYARDVEQLGAQAQDDEALARARLVRVEQRFRALEQAQAEVTDDMAREVERQQAAALDDEVAVQWRLALTAFLALAGWLALTYVLRRLGDALAAHAARERGVAEELQHSLLPDALPDLPGVRFAARYVPGGEGAEVGGDWYDVLPLPSGEVGLVMGDVVGHDLHAASAMGQLRNALRAYAAEGLPPEEVLERLNRLCFQQELGEMATVLYLVLDPVGGVVRFASAGHYPPLLVHRDGTAFLEHDPRPPIGAVREVGYVGASQDLPPDAVLALYTDGLVERRGEPVEAGMERLRAAVPPQAPDLEAVCDRVLAGLLPGGSPADDVALLLVSPRSRLGDHLELVWPARPDRLAPLRKVLERWLAEAGATREESFELVVAVSEASTNALEHAYGPGEAQFQVTCDLQDGTVALAVRDWGQWRAARGRDRGRGLSLVEALVDEAEVVHGDGGTEVRMRRRLARASGQPGAEEQPAGRREEVVL